MSKVMYGIYVHIPFCKSRCSYCNFYSTTFLDKRSSYVYSLCRELDLRSDYVSGKCKTIYIGGGTPSLLSYDDMKRLLIYINKVCDVCEDAEITVECNPDDVTIDYAKALKKLNVNRVSMGAQTFSDKRLEFLNRRHLSCDVFGAVKNLKAVGINNISVDLMFGFPGENLADWEEDIRKALDLDVKHISAYSLMLEENTLLYKMVKQGRVEEIDDNLSLDMYKLLVEMLIASGYEHYEISNFAKPGFRSRHNSSYWRNVPYIGIGAAAHSYDLKSRQWNVSDINEYIRNIDCGIVPFEREVLDKETMFNDMITTAMRTCEGVDLNLVSLNFGDDYARDVIKNSKKFIDSGLVEIKNNHLRLKMEGIFVSDIIMSNLMIV